MKLSDIKEFARMMILSLLTMFRHVQEMFAELIRDLRAFGRQMLQAVRGMTATLVRDLEELVRAVGRRFSGMLESLAERLKVVTTVLLRFAHRVSTFIHSQVEKVTEIAHRIHRTLKHFYFTALLPRFHRLIRFVRHTILLIRLAWKRLMGHVRSAVSRARRAFLKIGHVLSSAVLGILLRIRTFIVEILTRFHAFFRLIAHAFYRIGTWMIGILFAFWTRTLRAFKRCDIRFYVFFFLAVGVYWYVFINTYHRIMALIISFIIYQLAFETIILPILALIILWINRYHPVIALVKRSGLAFQRVWHSSVCITVSIALSILGTVRRSIIRSARTLLLLALLLSEGIVRLLRPPVLMLVSFFRSIGRRVRNAMFAILWTGFLFLRYLSLGMVATGMLLYHLLAAGLRVVRTGVKLILSLIGKFTLAAARTLKHAVLTVASVMVKMGKIIVRKAILILGFLAGILGLVATSFAAAMKKIGRAVLVLARKVALKLADAVRVGSGWIVLMVTAMATGIIALVRLIHRMILLAYTMLVRMVNRVARAVRSIYWTTVRVVSAVYGGIVTVIRRLATFVNLVIGAVVSVTSMITQAFLRIGTFIVNVVVAPIRRTGMAFRRTVITIAVGTALVITLILTGVHSMVIKVTLPVLSFMARNMLAWNRILFTIYFAAVKVGDLLISVLVWFGKILVSSTMALLRWSVSMVKLHYRGIRDISLIFSPSLAFLLAFLIWGTVLFLAVSVLYVITITIAAFYLSNRHKGDELNV